MFSWHEEGKTGIPIKVWLENLEQLDAECRSQAMNLSNLPFAFRHIALMPDAHAGFGMPIGGVLAAVDTIVPNAVGVDIGCGVAYVATDWDLSEVSVEILQKLVDNLMQRIPTGFSRHSSIQKAEVLDGFKYNPSSVQELMSQIQEGYFQIGTLGGGNHFIELQASEDSKLHVMIHSGSRNFGYKIAQYFNNTAKKLAKTTYREVPAEFDLAYLPIDSNEGMEYVQWMNLALRFAKENRDAMLNIVCEELGKMKSSIQFSNEINAHHNYAAQEDHFGRTVWIHRKGAISARKDELGIIPGAMGSYSYIVRGLGCQESFHSSPHGAGRKMGRKQAVRNIPIESTLSDLREKKVVLGKRKMKDVSEESRFAYKDIDWVIAQAAGLVIPIKKLSTLAVIKG